MTAPTVGLRTFTIEAVGARPLTVNAVARLHRQAWASHTRETRALWWLTARKAKVPHLAAIAVTATPLHSSGRSPQDVAACAPEVKAAIDGLVDAGVIVDDNARHLVAVTFLPPLITNTDGLRLLIEEVASCVS